MERISALSGEAKTGCGLSFITAAISFNPWPVNVQTIVAPSGRDRTGQLPQARSLQHFNNPATAAALAGSTKSPSLHASHRWAERISASDTISIEPQDSLKADLAIFQLAGLPILFRLARTQIFDISLPIGGCVPSVADWKNMKIRRVAQSVDDFKCRRFLTFKPIGID